MSIAEKILLLKEDMDTVYEKGKEKAMQAFADAYQDGGDRTNYYQAFIQIGWNDHSFSYIRHPILCKGDEVAATSVFSRCRMTRISVPVVIQGVIAREIFYYATALETIDDVTFLQVPEFRNLFAGCGKLKHIGIGGSIDVSFSVSASPELDEETRQSIVVHLKDLTDLETQTLTLHKTVGEKLTAEQKAAITAKNWTLVY